MLNETYSMTHLSLPPSEEQIACCLSNNQIYTLNLSQIEVLKQETELDLSDKSDDDNDRNFQLMLTPFHYKGITD